MAEAEQAYRRAAGLGARAPTTYYNLGLSLFRQGKEAEARYWFGEALKRDPGFLPARRALGIP
jgi:Flp pilus assembly protein TadD